MYYYLFDDRATKTLTQKQSRGLSSQIKTSSVAGEQYFLKSPQQIIEKAKSIATAKNTPTIVAIGDDLSLDLVITGVQSSTVPAAIGFIPTSNSSKSAQKLKIKDWRHGLKILPKRKTQSFDLLSCGNQFIFSAMWLKPSLDQKTTLKPLNLTLDEKLELQLPPSRIAVTNIADEQDYQETNYAIKLEAYATSNTASKLKNIKPIIDLDSINLQQRPPLILRIKSNQTLLQLTNTYLLNGVMPLSKPQIIKKASLGQEMILSRTDDPLSHS